MAVAVLHGTAGWLPPVPTSNTRSVHNVVLLPGTCLVMILVRGDPAPPVLAVTTSAGLDGLRASDALLS